MGKWIRHTAKAIFGIAERDAEGMCCPVEYSRALKDCFHKADKQLLHWLQSKHHSMMPAF